MAKEYGQACPVAKTLELVGERWTLLVVRDLLAGPRRFQDLQRSLPGVAPNMLSARLKRMEADGLIRRSFYSDHPPRASYELTDKGRELGVVVGALAVWGARHLHPETTVVSQDCGHPVQMGYFCPDCGGRVRGSSVTVDRAARQSDPVTAGRAAHRSAPVTAATRASRRSAVPARATR